jgi:hypothetical protein
MADEIKISGLSAAASSTSADTYPIVQSGTTKRSTAQQLSTLFETLLTKLTGLTGEIKYPTAITGKNGCGIRTDTNISDTLLLQAADVDGAVWVTFLTLTAGNTPTCDLSDSVTKSGGYIYRAGGTDVPVTDGGTGASTAAGARTALGLEIGVNIQAFNAALASISALVTSANKMVYTTASNTYATADLTSFARTILDDADAAAVRTTIGVSPIVNYVHVTGATQQMVENTIYYAENDVDRVIFTAPTTFSADSISGIIGQGSAGWGMLFNTGQYMRVSETISTVSVGSWASANRYDQFISVGQTANVYLRAISVIGQPNENIL